MTRKALASVATVTVAVAALTVGVAVASAPTLTITSPSAGQRISARKTTNVPVAGAVAFAAATPAAKTFYLRRDGCGTSSDNPHLSTASGADAGDGCGWIGGTGVVPAASETLLSIDFPATDGMPLALDASKRVDGVLTIQNDSVDGQNSLGAGAITVDVRLEALVGGDGVPIGSDTETAIIQPLASTVQIPFHVTVNRALDKADLNGLDLHVYYHGPYANSRYLKTSGLSTLTVPTYAASVHRSVQVSIDDPTFSRPLSTALNGSNWSLAIPTPSIGTHTVYARASQGFAASNVMSSTFTVKK